MSSIRHLEIFFILLWTVLITWCSFKGNGGLLGIDDADIFFVYAKNLASGKGLTYSLGIPPVEGYTSTLWMLLASLMFFLKLNEVGVLGLSMIFFAASQVVSFKIIDGVKLKNKSAIKLLYVWIISSSFGYITWTTVSLMDTGLWSCLLMGLIYFLVFGPQNKKSWSLLACLFGLAPLARPEAYLLCPILLGLFYLKGRMNHLSVRPVLCVCLGFLISVFSLTVFRLIYFGYPLPNTYYAKVSSSFRYNVTQGFDYLLGFLNSNVLANIALAGALLSGTLFLREIYFFVFKHGAIKRAIIPYSQECGLLSIFVLILLLLPVFSGGDHFNLFRFYQPAFPIIVILVLILGSIHLRLEKIPKLLVLPSIAFWIFWCSSKDNWPRLLHEDSPVKIEFKVAFWGKNLGASLNQIFSDSKSGYPSVGVIAAGGIGRFYKGVLYDLMGLNNSFIAHFSGERQGIKNHAAFQKAAFFALPIDLIPESPDNSFAQKALKGLFSDTTFVREWSYGRLALSLDPKTHVEAFFRNRFLQDLAEDSHFVFKMTKKYNSSEKKWDPIRGS